MYSIAFSTGGIAVVNLGDEVGMLNDYRGTVKDADKGQSESVWVTESSIEVF